MKVRFSIIISIIFTNLILAQIENPNVTPVTPESASLGRYGNVALNGATGQMNYNVPIHTIEVDGNSWPVALNYNYGGLILESKPSMAGLGWSLTAYGNITKETRGLPDGHPEGYYGGAVKAKIDATLNDYLADGVFNETLYNDLEKFYTGQWDSEVDKYTCNIGGNRFSFKIYPDAEGKPKPYFLSRHNFKVEITKDTYGGYFKMGSFIVTDDKGVKYYFDSDDREEVIHDPYEAYAQDNVTSWLLSEIKFVNGESIVFDYSQQHYYSYDYKASGMELDLDISTEGQDPTNVPIQDWAIDYSEQTNVTEMYRKVLDSITFPNGSIEFGMTTVESEYGSNNRTLFNLIIVKDHNNNTVNTYNLNYSGSRDALTKITKNGEKYYDFEYFGVNTPGHIPGFINSPFSSDYPHDQDYWKYYNNAGNTRSIHLPFSDELANKTPNFSATRLGALKRIIYPTGGYTEIEYGQNKEKVPYAQNPGEGGLDHGAAFNDEMFLRLDAHLDNDERFATIEKTFDYPVRASLYHKIIGNVMHGNSIYVYIQKISGESNSSYESCYGTGYSELSQPYYPWDIDNARNYLVQDPDECPYYPYPVISPRLIIEHDPDNHCVWWGSPPGSYGEAMGCVSETEVDALDDSGGSFYIVPGTYRFTIDVRHLYYDDLFAEIGLRWYDPAIDNGGTLPDFVNKDIGGIRVQKIVDYTDNGEFANAKFFNYNDDEGFSTARVNQIPYTKETHLWHHTQLGAETTMQLDNYYLNSYSAINVNHGTPVYYSQITTHSGNDPFDYSNYPNGYTVQKFSLPTEDHSLKYPKVPLQEDVSKAIPIETKIYDQFHTVKSRTENDYNIYRWLLMAQDPVTLELGTDYDNNNEHPWSFKYYKKLENWVNWDSGNFGNINPALNTPEDIALKSLHDIRLYREVNVKRKSNSEVGVTQGVTQSKTFTYDSSLQLQSVATLNSFGETTKIEYDYPYELSETQYQGMVSKNQVNIPVIQRNYNDGELVTQQKTNFETVSHLGIINGYRPKEILVAKGSENLVKEIEFNYNSSGDIKEYKRNDGFGMPTSIIWGYNETVPVAKIDNASYTSAISNITGGYNNMQNLDGENLRNALNGIRSALPEAQVTTYTHNPLIGVSSITNPMEETVHYDYDNLNRLKYIKDEDQNVLEEYRYHLRLDELSGSLTSNVINAYIGQFVNFNVFVTGGTGSYTFEWRVHNSNIDQTTSNSNNNFTVGSTSNHAPSYILTCKVIDINTNEFLELSRTIYVTDSLPPLSAGNIAASPSSGIAVGANITYSINASGGSGNYEYEWIKSNGLTNISYGTSGSSIITQPVVFNDCSSFTMACIITDTDTGNSITKTINMSVSSGCTGGNQ